MSKATCSIDGCSKSVKARDWCAMHYKRWKTHGDPLVNLYGQPRLKPPCSVEECDATSHLRGYCNKHYLRWKKYGDPLILKRSAPDGFTNETCRAEDCLKPTSAWGYCSMHYRRWNLYGSTDLPERPKKIVPECRIEDCRDPVECRNWCDKHYQRWRKWGDPLAFKPSEISIFCSQDNCGRRLAKAGVCWKHYRHFKAKFRAEQDGRCAICGVHEGDVARKMLFLDHDHATGQPRALLCHHCNVGLGLFRERIEVLQAAIRYLEEMKPGQLPLFAA